MMAWSFRVSSTEVQTKRGWKETGKSREAGLRLETEKGEERGQAAGVCSP